MPTMLPDCAHSDARATRSLARAGLAFLTQAGVAGLAGLAGLAAMSACTAELDVASSADLGAPAMTWEEFRASVYQEPFEHGVFIVDGDTPVSNEAELEDYYYTYVAPAWGELTVRNVLGADILWSLDGKYELTYCVSDSFGTQKATVVDTMAIATSSWSDLVGVRFRYLPEHDDDCTASNTSVVFDVNPVSTDQYFARAFFPDDPRSERRLLIDDSAFTTTFAGRDFQGILRHELGHTLGFRHEHVWLAGACTDETADEARAVTLYDENSVMHYPQCRTSGGGGYRQSDLDYQGAVTLYGLAPALIEATVF